MRCSMECLQEKVPVSIFCLCTSCLALLILVNSFPRNSRLSVHRLLTPPETPLFPSSEGNEFQPSFTVPRRSSAARSTSTSKPFREHSSGFLRFSRVMNLDSLDAYFSASPAVSTKVLEPPVITTKKPKRVTTRWKLAPTRKRGRQMGQSNKGCHWRQCVQ